VRHTLQDQNGKLTTDFFGSHERFYKGCFLKTALREGTTWVG